MASLVTVSCSFYHIDMLCFTLSTSVCFQLSS